MPQEVPDSKSEYCSLKPVATHTSEHITAYHHDASNGHSQRRDWKVLYDPFLSSSQHRAGNEVIYRFCGEVAPKESPIKLSDPRKSMNAYGRSTSRGRKKYLPCLKAIKFEYDGNSIGPPPPSSVFVSQLSLLTTPAHIHTYFSTYGEVIDVHLEKSPITGASLGLAKVIFGSGGTQGGDASTAAKRAVHLGNGRRIGDSIVKVEMDEDGHKMQEAVENATKHLFHESKETSSIIPPEQPHPSGSSSYRPSGSHYSPARGSTHSRSGSFTGQYPIASNSSYRPGSVDKEDPPPRPPVIEYKPNATGGASIGMEDGEIEDDEEGAIPEDHDNVNSRFRPRNDSFDQRSVTSDESKVYSRYPPTNVGYPPHSFMHGSSNPKAQIRLSEWRDRHGGDHWHRDPAVPVPSISPAGHVTRFMELPFEGLPELFKPCLTISRSHLPHPEISLEDVKKNFDRFTPDKIYFDTNRWYIQFSSAERARKCQTAMDQTSIMGYKLHLAYQGIKDDSFFTTSSHDKKEPTTAVAESNVQPIVPVKVEQPVKSLPQKDIYNEDIADEAELTKRTIKLLINDLCEVFMKDLRSRVITPLMYDFLKPESTSRRSSARTDSLNLKPEPSPAKQNPVEQGNGLIRKSMPSTGSTVSQPKSSSTQVKNENDFTDIIKINAQ
ncbi:histone methyltransferase set1, partial [Basidiobolus ranarum]